MDFSRIESIKYALPNEIDPYDRIQSVFIIHRMSVALLILGCGMVLIALAITYIKEPEDPYIIAALLLFFGGMGGALVIETFNGRVIFKPLRKMRFFSHLFLISWPLSCWESGSFNLCALPIRDEVRVLLFLPVSGIIKA